jgi:hypothetical protein
MVGFRRLSAMLRADLGRKRGLSLIIILVVIVINDDRFRLWLSHFLQHKTNEVQTNAKHANANNQIPNHFELLSKN